MTDEWLNESVCVCAWHLTFKRVRLCFLTIYQKQNKTKVQQLINLANKFQSDIYLITILYLFIFRVNVKFHQYSHNLFFDGRKKNLWKFSIDRELMLQQQQQQQYVFLYFSFVITHKNKTIFDRKDMIYHFSYDLEIDIEMWSFFFWWPLIHQLTLL